MCAPPTPRRVTRSLPHSPPQGNGNLIFDYLHPRDAFYDFGHLPNVRQLTLSTGQRVRLYINKKWLYKIGACDHCYGPAGRCSVACQMKQEAQPNYSKGKRPRGQFEATTSKYNNLYDSD